MELIQNTSKAPQAEASSYSIQDILQQCLANWYWFVLSIVVVVGIAYVYLISTPPVYTRSASLLIKEGSQGKSAVADVGSTFSDMGLFQVNTNVNNEIFSLQSPAVMLDVVKRLHLDVDYKADGTFYRKTLYGQDLPFSIDFLGLQDNETVSLTVVPLPEGRFRLQDFEHDGREFDETVEAVFGDTLSTPVGQVILSPTPFYKQDETAPVYITRIGLNAAVAAYSSHLAVALVDDKSTIINLSFTDVNIHRAEDVLNTLIGVYNENWVKDRNQIAVSTSMFINERLGVIEQELGNVDEDISSYKSEHLLPDVQAASNLYMAQSSETNARILALNTQLSMARYIRSYLTGAGSRGQLLPANSGLESSNIESQISEYNTLQLQRNNLVANSSEQNPLVVDLDQSLKAMRTAIITSIDNLVVTLNTQLHSLRQSEQHTTARLAESPSQAKYLLSVERQQKVKESLYLFLLQKREENELSQAFTAYNTRVITPPGGSMVPTYPVKKMILMVAFVIAIALPVLVIFLRILLNTTVRGRKDMENMDAPFIGEIPQYGKKAHSLLWWRKQAEKDVLLPVVVKEKKRDIINEAFRVVRTNLEFVIGNQKDIQVLMVTSFNPGSGKTFITVNLATCLAIKKKKVLVIDLDLRRASLSRYAAGNKVGISNYLAGQAVTLQDLIVPVKDENSGLDILPVGTLPPNPTELLVSERLEQLLQELRMRYDYILIDCPPVEVVADAAIISKLADMTLFVVRAGLLERSMLPEIDRLYQENKYKNLSVLLNGTEAATGRYGYHKYGYRYGYHYGYGNYDQA